jgi:hypothetical protein
VDRQALDAQFAAQAEALRAMRAAAPPPRTPPPTLRPERAALWRIAMLCKAALGNQAVRPEMHPYFVQIARVCREVVERREEDV